MIRRVLVLAMLLTGSVWSQPSGKCDVQMQGNAMFVRGTVGHSEPLNLAVDSGSIRTSLDEPLAQKLGFDLSMKAESSGGNGRQTLSILRDITLTLCGKQVVEPIVVVYPLDFLTKALKRPLDGIVGIEIFRKYVVILDYPARSIEIQEPETFTYKGSGKSVPVAYAERLPYVAGFITPFGGEPIPVKLMVDSGGSGLSVDFYNPFEKKHQIVAGLRDARDSYATMFTGNRPVKRGRIQELRIGELVINEPEVQVLGPSKAGEFGAWDGTIGSGFLKQFRVIFDLPHDRIVFEHPK